jgi:hypothetical protein
MFSQFSVVRFRPRNTLCLLCCFSQLIAPMLRRSAFYHTPLPAQPATLSEFRLSERSHNWSSVKKPDRALIGDEVAQDCDQDFALS